MKGGQTTTSTWSVSFFFFLPGHSSRASGMVLYIFQLPAIIRFSHLYHLLIFVSQGYYPGSCFPSKNSSEAPPPVEMWVIFSAKPTCSTAAAESPPPTIVIASTSAIAWAVPLVPTPRKIGVFKDAHRTVPDHSFSFFNRRRAYNFTVSGLISTPSRSAGIASAGTVFLMVGFFSKSSVTTTSTGSNSFYSLRFNPPGQSSLFSANSIRFASNSKVLPISNPLALRKVKAIPANDVEKSTLFRKMMITLIYPQPFGWALRSQPTIVPYSMIVLPIISSSIRYVPGSPCFQIFRLPLRVEACAR